MTFLQPVTPLVGGGQLDRRVAGLQRLASYRFAAAGSSTPIISLPPRDELMVALMITSTSAAAIPTMQVGASADAVDSGVAYWHRNMESVPSGDVVAGNFNNTGTANEVRWVLGYSALTVARLVFITILNIPGGNSVAKWSSVAATASAATPGNITAGWGEWFTTPPVVSMQIGLSAVANYGLGSGVVVFGKSH